MPILLKPIILICNTCGLWIHAGITNDGGVLLPVMCDAQQFHVKPGEVAHQQGCRGSARVMSHRPGIAITGAAVLDDVRACEMAPPMADVTQGPLVNSPPVVTCLACRRRAGGKLDQVTDEGDNG